MRKLVLQDGASSKEFHVVSGVTLGRDPSNAIPLSGGKIEELHAKISIVGPHVFIEDLDSLSGTLLNGKKITKIKLNKGDRIEIGGAQLVYDEDDRPDPPPPKPAATKPPEPKPPAKAPAPAPARPPTVPITRTPPHGMPPARPPTAPMTRTPPHGMSPAHPREPEARAPRIALPGSSGSFSSPGQLPPKMSGGSASSSSRRPAVGRGGTSIAVSGELARAQEAAARASSKRSGIEAPKPSKMTGVGIVVMLLLLVVPILVVFAVPHWQRWRKEANERKEATRAESEALVRLKTVTPKDPADLNFALAQLRAAREWKQVEELLGKADLECTDGIMLWDFEKGTFTESGAEYRAYFTKDKYNPNSTEEGSVAPILLFRLDSGSGVVFVGSRFFARRETPPLPKRSGEEGGEPPKGDPVVKNPPGAGDPPPEGAPPPPEDETPPPPPDGAPPPEKGP